MKNVWHSARYSIYTLRQNRRTPTDATHRSRLLRKSFLEHFGRLFRIRFSVRLFHHLPHKPAERIRLAVFKIGDDLRICDKHAFDDLFDRAGIVYLLHAFFFYNFRRQLFRCKHLFENGLSLLARDSIGFKRIRKFCDVQRRNRNGIDRFLLFV